ncbi:MAG: hypothetical protein H0V17_35575 [Deltaproteobacteria bacterium]|nr:hypothetical protein [Deltaproteobacteria bacterium]
MSITFLLPYLFATPPSACAAQGTPLIEMRQASERDASVETTTRIFGSGAWVVETAGRTQRGCFDRAEVRTIRRAVQRAPWQTVSSPVACFAYDPNFTEYRVHGKLRFVERMCSGKAADSATAQTIDLVKAELADEKPVMPAPIGCRAAGTPMFEIHKLSEEAEPTSKLALYANGAWTFQPIDAYGHAGAMATGCLDKRTIAPLRTEIAQAPWETTLSRMVCRAYSPSSTQYFVHGKREFTARLCGPERLDPQSLAAIKRIESELAVVLPAR